MVTWCLFAPLSSKELRVSLLLVGVVCILARAGPVSLLLTMETTGSHRQPRALQGNGTEFGRTPFGLVSESLLSTVGSETHLFSVCRPNPFPTSAGPVRASSWGHCPRPSTVGSGAHLFSVCCVLRGLGPDSGDSDGNYWRQPTAPGAPQVIAQEPLGRTVGVWHIAAQWLSAALQIAFSF